MIEHDKIWRSIANTYSREYSSGLRQELDTLEPFPTPGLDRKIRRFTAREKRARSMRIWGGLAAACLALALLTPSILRVVKGPQVGAPLQSSGAAQPSEAAPSDGMIPLSFTLPEQFSVVSVEQDNGKTIYALDDRNLDPVIITLERGGDTAFFETLTPLTLEGQEVYGSSGGGYQLLTFEKEGVVYELTCQYDINTLADLSRTILV